MRSSPSRVLLPKATAPPEIYTLSLHDALPISEQRRNHPALGSTLARTTPSLRLALLARFYDWGLQRSEEHTSELQSRGHLVCRLLLEKKNKQPKSRIR